MSPNVAGTPVPGPKSYPEPQISENARCVLEARYLKKHEDGQVAETPRDLFTRVAATVADIETQYGAGEMERSAWQRRYYDLMISGRFMPNSPTLMNAGREMGMLSACFVLPVRDSINEIFDSIKHTALIQKAGGGTGFAFDELRPTGDFIKSSGGTTSGPISFWKAFSEATNAIQQGAFRRGANMGMMYVHHPDILKFLHAKQDLSAFTNYNISVKITDAWMEEFRADPDSPQVVRNPRTGKAYVIPRETQIWEYDIRSLVEVDCVEAVDATSGTAYYTTPRLTGPLPAELAGQVYTKREIWDIIINNAWKTGEPGVVFIDRINEQNPTPHVGRIEATNPCGEQPLLPYEACNLGSVNLGAFVCNACTPQADVDWNALREAVHLATRFLDNVIDANNYPLPEIERICHANRKIGLGIMGFADALYKLGVPYNSDAGVTWGERFMKFVNDEAHTQSEQLARERGCFENWPGSIWQTRHRRLMRNAAVTTVAPTGTISMIANCSGGIEPLFSVAFLRNVLRGQVKDNQPLVEVNGIFREVATRRGVLTDEILERAASEGTLAHIDELPEDLRRVFVCAHDITPAWHVRMQAAFQKHCDSSISKTINFPTAATVDDVRTIYEMAFEQRCKGVTVYRDGCREFQPMSRKTEEKQAAEAPAASDSNGKTTPPVEEPHILPRRIEPCDLPAIVSGLRIRQATPFGNMHVKITVDPRDERELEVFAQLGKGGDVANSDLEGLCRTASLWLRAGGSIVQLIKQWEGIGTSMQIPTRDGRIMSLPDGLACALKKYLRAKERFGLRSLLLGEVDPADVDRPDAPPHTNATTHDRRPAATDPAPAGGPAKVATVNRVVRQANGDTIQQAGQQESKAGGATAKRIVAQHRANGNGNGHGNGHTPSIESATAVLEPPAPTAGRLSQVVDELTETVAADTAAAAASTKRAAPRHSHDSAANYKVPCPECGHTLAFQEGCRKCSACGWSAC